MMGLKRFEVLPVRVSKIIVWARYFTVEHGCLVFHLPEGPILALASGEWLMVREPEATAAELQPIVNTPDKA